MKKLFVVIVIALLPFLVFSQQTITKSMMHDGKERSYITYIPDNYTGDTAVPLVFNFHGYTSNATEQMWYGDFRAIADTAGFIIVHPEGTLLNGSTHWNVGGWTLGSTTDDVGFTEAMIDALAGQYNIDLDRIYSTGMSNGGYMSFLLACQLGDKIAAVASVTGSMTPQIFDNCNPTHPTPILQVHGLADPVVPYFGAAWTKPINDVVAYWTAYNRCSNTPIVTAVPNTSLLDGSTVKHELYEGGDNGTIVEHYRITGGGHTWPGTASNSLGTNQDFDASLEIWRFFSRYDLSGVSGVTSTPQQNDDRLSIKVYPNPTNAQLTIESSSFQPTNYQLMSITGRALLSGVFNRKNQGLDLSHLPNGLYILQAGTKSFKIMKAK